jgi:hypothetical protein
VPVNATWRSGKRRITHVECGWTLAQQKIMLEAVKQLEALGTSENAYYLLIDDWIDGYMRSLMHEFTAGPYHPLKTRHWSRKAIEAYKNDKKSLLRVAHGTAKRNISRLVFAHYKAGKLTEDTMLAIAQRYWKIAVLTKEENSRLDKVARSTMHDTPDERWALIGAEIVSIKGFDAYGNIVV